jgi:hypothetical protein
MSQKTGGCKLSHGIVPGLPSMWRLKIVVGACCALGMVLRDSNTWPEAMYPSPSPLASAAISRGGNARLTTVRRTALWTLCEAWCLFVFPQVAKDQPTRGDCVVRPSTAMGGLPVACLMCEHLCAPWRPRVTPGTSRCAGRPTVSPIAARRSIQMELE